MDHTNATTSLSDWGVSMDMHGGRRSPAARAKVDRIWKACEEDRDIEALVQLATSENGLVDDEVRQKACTSVV